MEKVRMTYAARIWQDGEWWMAEFPQLEQVTNAKSKDDILYMASDCLETYFYDFIHDSEQPPKPDLDIELRPGDQLVIVSVYADPVADFELTTHEVMELLGVNKQRVAQLRNAGRINAYKQGRDYLHSRSDVYALKDSQRRPGRPKRDAVAA